MENFWTVVNMIWVYTIGLIGISFLTLIITWWENGRKQNFKDFWKTF